MTSTLTSKLTRWRWMLAGIVVMTVLAALPATASAALTPAQIAAQNRQITAEWRLLSRNLNLERRQFFASQRRTAPQIAALNRHLAAVRSAFLVHIRRERQVSPFRLVFFYHPVHSF